MKKIIAVARHEIVTTLSRVFYVVLVFGLPIIALIIMTAVTLIRGDGKDENADDQQPATELEIAGFVDYSGIIETIPPDLPEGHLLAFASEEEAKEALENGDIDAFYIVPETYIEDGEFLYMRAEASPFSPNNQDWVMRWTLTVNLLGGDFQRASLVWNPAWLEPIDLNAPVTEDSTVSDSNCSRPNPDCESSGVVRYIPMVIMVMFFVFITQSSGFLLRSVSGEKENRTIEVIMLSLKPRELLIGKILGLGAVSLLQMLVWVGSGYAALRIGGTVLQLPEEFSLPVDFLIWSILFFLLGYLVYASLMAGAGALVPRIKESTQAVWVVIMPLFIAYMLGLFLVQSGDPHSGIMLFMSLFPLTSPLSMVQRMAIGGIPTWQMLLSVGLLAATCVLVIASVSRMFRAQTLLTGQPFKAKVFFRALLFGE